MEFVLHSRPSVVHRWFGFFLPLPLFIQPGSPIILAHDAVAEGATAFPFSLVVLPIALIWSALRGLQLSKATAGPYLGFFVAFLTWTSLLAVWSSTISSQSFLYATQWVLPFFWYFYFAGLRSLDRLKVFANGFAQGAFAGAFFTFAAGALEIVFYGGLTDSGRMAQNLVLPGHYQLYVYVPTVIAFSSLLTFVFFKAGLLATTSRKIYILLAVSMTAIVFTGAREGIIAYGMGLIGLWLVWGKYRVRRVFLLASIASIVIALILLSQIELFPGFEDIRLVSKFMDLREQGREFAGRDQIIELYWNVIADSPLFGSAMLPPAEVSAINVDAPSAHNYYIDAFAWGGAVNISLLMAFLGYMVLICGVSFWRGLSSSDQQLKVNASIALLLMIFLIVSNNINVPLRQPLTGSICVLMIYLALERRSFDA